MKKALLLSLLLLVPFLAGSGELEEKKDKLHQIHTQIREEKKKEQELRARENREKQLLEEAKKKLEDVNRELDKYRNELLYTGRKLTYTSENLLRKTRQILEHRNLISDRSRVFYRSILLPSSSEGLDGLFKSRKFFSTLYTFRLIADQDINSLRQAESEKKIVEITKYSLEKEIKKLKSCKTQKEAEKKNVESGKKKHEEAISKVSRDLNRSLERQRMLAKEASELQKIIESLSAKTGTPAKVLEKEALLFEREKDNLPWPVSKGKVVSYFGWSTSEKYAASVFNSGIDIEVEGEEKVTSIGKGKILFSGSFRSYGKMVIVDHGGGYCSVYSGLKENLARVNQEVEKGEVIGTVSSSLHLEMRKNARPIDPLEWLKNR